MTSTNQARYNADEAKKELLATLHASRELGPEMDDALADRFMDQLKALRPVGSYDPARARADLSVLIQSARGSDPVGDDALAEGYLARLQPPLPAVQPMPGAPAPQWGGPQSELGRVVPLVIAGAIVITAMVLTRGEMWWLIFFLPALLGWLRGGGSRRRMRYYRYNRVMRPDDPYRQLPPSGNPPEIL